MGGGVSASASVSLAMRAVRLQWSMLLVLATPRGVKPAAVQGAPMPERFGQAVGSRAAELLWSAPVAGPAAKYPVVDLYRCTNSDLRMDKHLESRTQGEPGYYLGDDVPLARTTASRNGA